MALDFNAVALETTEAKGGYGIGLQIGQQLLSSGMEVDAEAVARGINDVLNQNPPAIDLNDVTKALQELGARAEAAQAEAFKAIEADNKAFLEENKKAKGVVVTESGLQYEVLTEGTGAKPTAASSVRVHYTGSLIDGTVFDSSVKRGTPAEFAVGGGIRGRRRNQRLDGSVTINDRRFKMAFNHPARVSIRRAWRRRINSSVCHLNFRSRIIRYSLILIQTIYLAAVFGGFFIAGNNIPLNKFDKKAVEFAKNSAILTACTHNIKKIYCP